jgi:hypothetical protein
MKYGYQSNDVAGDCSLCQHSFGTNQEAVMIIKATYNCLKASSNHVTSILNKYLSGVE